MAVHRCALRPSVAWTPDHVDHHRIHRSGPCWPLPDRVRPRERGLRDRFAAFDVDLQRRVAVKVLHPALAADGGFLRRFRAEAQSAAALANAHVLAVHDWGEDAQGPFLVLEFLGGGRCGTCSTTGDASEPVASAPWGRRRPRGSPTPTRAASSTAT